MATSFADCCIRYGQEYVYTTFSEGNMTLGEIYISLIYALIDPSCLPAMAIIHYDKENVTCFNIEKNRLRMDLEQHAVEDHFNGFSVALLKNLSIYYCNICQTTTRIMCEKSNQRRFYTIVRECGRQPNRPYHFSQPWSQLTFAQMCYELLEYNPNVSCHTISPKPTEKSFCSTATQTAAIHFSDEHANIGSQSPQTVGMTPPIDFRQQSFTRNDNDLRSDVSSCVISKKIEEISSTMEKNDKIKPIVSTSELQNTSETRRSLPKRVGANQKSSKSIHSRGRVMKCFCTLM